MWVVVPEIVYVVLMALRLGMVLIIPAYAVLMYLAPGPTTIAVAGVFCAHVLFAVIKGVAGDLFAKRETDRQSERAQRKPPAEANGQGSAETSGDDGFDRAASTETSGNGGFEKAKPGQSAVPRLAGGSEDVQKDLDELAKK